jgi:hypothetical protein
LETVDSLWLFCVFVSIYIYSVKCRLIDKDQSSRSLIAKDA